MAAPLTMYASTLLWRFIPGNAELVLSADNLPVSVQKASCLHITQVTRHSLNHRPWKKVKLNPNLCPLWPLSSLLMQRYSLTNHGLTYVLTTHNIAHSCTHLLSQSLTYPLPNSLISSLTHPYTHSLHSPTHPTHFLPLTHSSKPYSCTHSLSHSVHSLTH